MRIHKRNTPVFEIGQTIIMTGKKNDYPHTVKAGFWVPLMKDFVGECSIKKIEENSLQIEYGYFSLWFAKKDFI